MTRLLASAAACLALTLFAAPTTFAVPVPGIAPIAFDGDCGGCKGKEAKPAGDEKPATSSVQADAMGEDCGGCKGKEAKPAGDEKPATSSVQAEAMGEDCGGCKGKEAKPAGDEKPAAS